MRKRLTKAEYAAQAELERRAEASARAAIDAMTPMEKVEYVRAIEAHKRRYPYRPEAGHHTP